VELRFKAMVNSLFIRKNENEVMVDKTFAKDNQK